MLLRRLKSSLLIATSVFGAGLLASCSGGESTTPPPPPPPPPANNAPVFTSAASTNVPEDTAAGAVIYTATATDADSDPLTYTISGGADAARFQISAAGALSFVASLDFDNPADADGNSFTWSR